MRKIHPHDHPLSERARLFGYFSGQYGYGGLARSIITRPIDYERTAVMIYDNVIEATDESLALLLLGLNFIHEGEDYSAVIICSARCDPEMEEYAPIIETKLEDVQRRLFDFCTFFDGSANESFFAGKRRYLCVTSGSDALQSNYPGLSVVSLPRAVESDGAISIHSHQVAGFRLSCSAAIELLRDGQLGPLPRELATAIKQPITEGDRIHAHGSSIRRKLLAKGNKFTAKTIQNHPEMARLITVINSERRRAGNDLISPEFVRKSLRGLGQSNSGRPRKKLG